MKIENYGSGERTLRVMRMLVELSAEGALAPEIDRVMLLPIPSARDGVHITGTDRLICEVLLDVQPGDLVAGYGIPSEDVDIIRAAGGALYDAACDEDFLSENGRLSALGALGYLLHEAGCDPAGCRVGLVGWGRIGSRLGEMLVYHGATLTVYTTSERTRLSLGACGIGTVGISPEGGAIPTSDVDFLINTAPIPLSATFADGAVRDGLTVIDLASGTPFEGVRGVKKLPAIPEKYFPDAAARAYLKGLLRAMEVSG